MFNPQSIRFGASESSPAYPYLVINLLFLVGLESLLQKLKVKPDVGLSGGDFVQRTEHFGSNYREPLKVKPFCKLFIETLDDFMLKVLIVCAIFSIVFEMALNMDHWQTGK